MSATVSTDRNSQRAKVFFVLFLLTQLCLDFLFLPTQQAYANELHTIQLYDQQSVDQEGSSPGYEIFSFCGEDAIDTQISQSSSVPSMLIPDSDVPLSSYSRVGQISPNTNNGSLFNTALAVVCVLSMAAMLLLFSIRKIHDHRALTTRIIAVSVGLVTFSTWSLLDKLQLPTTIFNDSSILMAVFFGAYVVIAIASYVYEAMA